MLLCGQLTENALTCVISIIVEAIFSFELLNLTIGSVSVWTAGRRLQTTMIWYYYISHFFNSLLRSVWVGLTHMLL